MSAAVIDRARELLGDKADHISFRLGIIGALAIALVAGDLAEGERAEARAIIIAFWQEWEAAR